MGKALKWHHEMLLSLTKLNRNIYPHSSYDQFRTLKMVLMLLLNDGFHEDIKVEQG